MAHERGTGYRLYWLRATETAAVPDWMLAVWDAQEFVYSVRRSSFERRIGKTDDGTSVFGRNQ